jgi:hypothetical protein
MTERGKIFAHLSPIWEHRSDFILHAWVEDDCRLSNREQLWGRKVAANRVEICCIPFFVYDLALGDIAQFELDSEQRPLLKKVVIPSGHYTFRVWFGECRGATARDDVLAEMQRLGSPVEWYSENLLAIDAAPDIATAVAGFLSTLEATTGLVYETGKTARKGSSALRRRQRRHPPPV